VSAPSANPVYPAADGRNGWHVTSPVAVSVNGSDTVSGVATADFSINDGAWQTQAILTDGGYSVNFRVVDQAGNSSIVSRMIRVDSQPPTVIPVIPNPNGWDGWFITGPVDITGNGSDSGSGLAETWLSIDGGPWVPYAALGEGIHSVIFKAIDQAGNSATVSRTVKVDTSLPVIRISISGTEGNAGWYTSSTTTTISADDLSGARRIEYNQNGTGWQDDAVFVSREGINNIDLRILDMAGNMATGSMTIKVDATPPTISTTTEGTEGLVNWYISQATTRILATDENSGVDHVEYNQNEAGWQNGTSVESNDGINTIGIRAYDVAGNVSTDSLDVKVDTIAPVVQPVMPSPDGLNDWFITGPVAVSTSGSDSGSGLASALASANGGNWESNLLLSDGIYTVDFQSEDEAGNTATTSQTVKIDTEPPSLSVSIMGTAGNNGWYVSQTNTTISALDKTSGADRIEYNQNETEWKVGTSVVSKDGINEIGMRAYDLAGNIWVDHLRVKIDTVKPTSTFTSPGNGSSDTLARGIVSLSGSSKDITSGISSAEISLDGMSWLPLEIGSENKWTYEWNTSTWLDGIYPIVVRSTDIAGNTELVDSGGHITLLVNNSPPHIKLTPEWFIWQSGTLLIKTEYFPVRDGTIVIADKERRWPEIRIPFGEKYPAEIKWDRRFANGILAPSGDYRVTVSACNIYDLCSEKSAVIKIPWYVPALPTVSVPTKIVDVEKEPKPQLVYPLSTMVPSVTDTTVVAAVQETKPIVVNDVAHSLLSLVPLIALMWAISSAALADKRPIAIRAITHTISSQKNEGE
jgi:hypothetical protein